MVQLEALQVVTHTTSQPPDLRKQLDLIQVKSGKQFHNRLVHTCHTFHARHSRWGETSLPWSCRLLMELLVASLELLVASLVMLLVKASLLMLRQARLGGWEVGLRREGRWLHS